MSRVKNLVSTCFSAGLAALASRPVRPCTVLSLMFCAMTVLGQQLVDISNCARILADSERVACYDNLAREIATLPPTTTTATPPATTGTTATTATTATTGTTGTTGTTAAEILATEIPATEIPPTTLTAEQVTNTLAVPVGTTLTVTSANPVAPVIIAEPTQQRVNTFGSPAQARIEANSRGQEILIDSISEVKIIKLNLVEITLLSGQVWQQMIARRFLLREGEEVAIQPNPWGESFRLSVAGRNGFIQVKRIDNKTYR